MAAGNTYVSIATQTLGSAAASVTFSSISSTYTDLVLVMQPAGGSVDIQYQFNADTGSNYSYTYLGGNGTAATSGRGTSTAYIQADNFGYATSTLGQNTTIAQIMNYSNATTYKTVISRTNNATTGVDASVGLWRSTAAITQVLIKTNATTFSTGSTFTLYGILAA